MGKRAELGVLFSRKFFLKNEYTLYPDVCVGRAVMATPVSVWSSLRPRIHPIDPSWYTANSAIKKSLYNGATEELCRLWIAALDDFCLACHTHAYDFINQERR